MRPTSDYYTPGIPLSVITAKKMGVVSSIQEEMSTQSRERVNEHRRQLQVVAVGRARLTN